MSDWGSAGKSQIAIQKFQSILNLTSQILNLSPTTTPLHRARGGIVGVIEPDHRRTRALAPRRNAAAPGHLDAPRADHFTNPVRSKHLEQAVNLILGPGRFYHQRFGAHVDDPRPVDVDELHDLR